MLQYPNEPNSPRSTRIEFPRRRAKLGKTRDELVRHFGINMNCLFQRRTRWASLLALLCSASVVFCVAASAADSTRETRTAIEKALPLIEQSSAFTLQERACFTCHHGAHPAMALNAAWSRGFKINRSNLDDQLERAYRELVGDVPRFKEGYSVSKTADGPGHELWMLDANGWKADYVATAAVGFFLNENKDLDHWVPPMNRPPTVGSPFTTTFLVLRALQQHASPAQRKLVAQRTEAARKWLNATRGEDNEDKVYRVRALHLLKDSKGLRTAADDLLKSQREDGGWAQSTVFESDAYAAGTALAALSDAEVLAPKDVAFARGVAFLLSTQEKDGSWFVRKRTHAVQPFFQSLFPHGQDQFIAISATCWATYALVKTLPAATNAHEGPYLATRPAAQQRLRSGGVSDAPGKFSEAQIAFFRDKIQPVLNDRCYECHSASAKKLKADLFLDTRGGILAGGASGPALKAGDPEHSLIIQALEGEKCELMPPKKRLPASVVNDFKKWIEMGAPDPRTEKTSAAK